MQTNVGMIHMSKKTSSNFIIEKSPVFILLIMLYTSFSLTYLFMENSAIRIAIPKHAKREISNFFSCLKVAFIVWSIFPILILFCFLRTIHCTRFPTYYESISDNSFSIQSIYIP